MRDTQESRTDLESRLFKKSAAGEVQPSYLGHLLTETRHGLVVQARVSESGKCEEREAALRMLPELLRARKSGEGRQEQGKHGSILDLRPARKNGNWWRKCSGGGRVWRRCDQRNSVDDEESTGFSGWQQLLITW